MKWVDDFKHFPVGGLTFAAVIGVLGLTLSKELKLFTPPPPGIPLEVVINARLDGPDVLFQLVGRKLTDQILIAQVASWTYSDGTAMSVAYQRDDLGSAPPGIGGPVRVQGEAFVSALYRARVPGAVANDPGASFRVCWLYETLPVYCEEVAYSTLIGG